MLEKYLWENVDGSPADVLIDPSATIQKSAIIEPGHSVGARLTVATGNNSTPRSRK